MSIIEMTPSNIIAINAYRGVGISEQASDLDNSILGILNNQLQADEIQFTEQYFYEETSFIAFILIEMDYRFNYLSKVSQFALQEGVITNMPDVKEVIDSIIELLYIASGARIEAAQLTQNMDSDTAIDTINQRASKCIPIVMENVRCVDEIPNGMEFIWSGERAHPFQKLIGEAYDNISSSIQIHNGLQTRLLPTAILAKYNICMDVGRAC
jgi:hypothetical protein